MIRGNRGFALGINKRNSMSSGGPDVVEKTCYKIFSEPLLGLLSDLLFFYPSDIAIILLYTL